MGIMQASLDTEVPVSFGILTTYTEEQAKTRSQTKGDLASHNKGREAAAACLESAQLLASITQAN
jgi:6,7-dimethyl-8-ribityllumazine synthase